MTAPVPVRCEVTFRFVSPGLQGPVERTYKIDLDDGADCLVTAPEQMQRLNFESDCLTHANRWINQIEKEKRTIAKQIESVTYTSAVLAEAFGAAE